MSKNMQLKVSVLPHYQKNLKGSYPRLARHLGYLDSDLVDQNPSLYSLVGQLDRMLYRFDGTLLRDVLYRQREKLQNIYKELQDDIACWKLSQADKLLYSIEDIFDEIESDLD
jgi:hypothetical protein